MNNCFEIIRNKTKKLFLEKIAKKESKIIAAF